MANNSLNLDLKLPFDLCLISVATGFDLSRGLRRQFYTANTGVLKLTSGMLSHINTKKESKFTPEGVTNTSFCEHHYIDVT